jgi:hypothetical protein
LRRYRPLCLALAGLVFVAALGIRAAEPPEKEPEKAQETEEPERRSPKEEELHLCLDRSGQLVYQTEACPPQAVPPPPAEAAAPVAAPPKASTPKPVAKPAVAKLPAKLAPKPTSPTKPPETPTPSPLDKTAKRQIRYAKPTAPAKRLRVEALPNVDPRYATPERTWSTFSSALRAGDGTAARSCLTPGALEGLVPSVDSVIGGGPWSAFVDDGARVEPEGHTGPFWSMRIERRGVRPKWVFLVRGERGEWKIAAL